MKQKRSGGRAAGPDPAVAWSRGLRVAADGRGVVAHARVVLPRLLADRLGLTAGLRQVVARRGFVPGRDRGRLLADTVRLWPPGRPALLDVEAALTRQEELFGIQYSQLARPRRTSLTDSGWHFTYRWVVPAQARCK